MNETKPLFHRETLAEGESREVREMQATTIRRLKATLAQCAAELLDVKRQLASTKFTHPCSICGIEDGTNEPRQHASNEPVGDRWLCDGCMDDEEEAPYCGSCGQPCGTKRVDTGIGPYEYAGAPGYDRQEWDASACCEAVLYANAGLTKEYED